MQADIDCTCNGKKCPMYDNVLDRCELQQCPQQWDNTRLICAYTEILENMKTAKE